MADIITAGELVIAPTLILGYESERAGGTLTHPILGRPDPDVTLRPAGLRTGTLELLFDGDAAEAESAAAENAHATPAVFTLHSDDRPSIAMSYVVRDGSSIGRQLEDVTREAWIVSVPFHEVRA